MDEQTEQTMTPADFTGLFKTKMITSYPVIAQMTADELYFSTEAEADAAFQRILDSINLRRTCEIEYGNHHG